MATGDIYGLREDSGKHEEIKLQNEFPLSADVRHIVVLTESEYTALNPKDDETLYFVTADPTTTTTTTIVI